MPNIDVNLIAHIAYSFFLLSYLMRDIFWLRVLMVVAFALLLPYFYSQPERLWEPILWNTAFFVINAVWISKLIYDRRPVRFTAEQKRLWQTALHRLSPRHARALFKTAKRRDVAKNETIVSSRQTLDYVALIVEGEATLTMHDRTIETIGPGHFIGSAMVLESGGDFPSATTIVAAKDCRMLTWRNKDVRRLIRKDHNFSVAFEATLGLDIAQLLIRAWHRQALPAQ